MAFVETYLSPRYCTESVKYCRSSQRGRFHISRRTVGDDRSGALWSSRRGDAPVRRPARQRQSAREERGRRHLAPARSHRGESLRGAADGPRPQIQEEGARAVGEVQGPSTAAPRNRHLLGRVCRTSRWRAPYADRSCGHAALQISPPGCDRFSLVSYRSRSLRLLSSR
jgi:hypothetical protein